MQLFYQYRTLQHEIKQIKQRIERLDILAKSPPIAKITGMPRAGRVSDGMDIIAKIDELRGLYAEKEEHAIELQKAAEGKLSGLEPDERIIFRYKYFDGLRNGDIADVIGYSESTIKRRIKSAQDKIKGGV